MILSPVDGTDIYVSALAVQGLAWGGDLTPDDWRAFSSRVKREVEDDGLIASVAGPASTALELIKASQLSNRTLVSRRFERALRATGPQDDDDFDLYDGIAAMALAGSDQTPALRGVRAKTSASLASVVAKHGCGSTETLFALGAAAGVNEKSGQCSPAQTQDLVASQLRRAAADIKANPTSAGLPHAEVLLASAKLARAGVDVDLGLLVATGQSLLTTLGRNRASGTAAAVGVVAQAFDAVDRRIQLSTGLATMLHRTVAAGGEPQSVILGPTARAVVARTMSLLGDKPPARLLGTAEGLNVADQLDVVLAGGGPPARTLVAAVIQDLRTRVSPNSTDTHPAGVTVLLRAANRLGRSSCSLAGVRDLVETTVSVNGSQPIESALRLRWSRLCGRPDPQGEKRLLDAVPGVTTKFQRGPTSEELLRAWQAGGVLCALAPDRLRPKVAWRQFRDLGDPHGGVPGEDGMPVGLTNTFALASLSADPSLACRSGTFG